MNCTLGGFERSLGVFLFTLGPKTMHHQSKITCPWFSGHLRLRSLIRSHSFT